jgi:hypothetical protein
MSRRAKAGKGQAAGKPCIAIRGRREHRGATRDTTIFQAASTFSPGRRGAARASSDNRRSAGADESKGLESTAAATIQL